MSVSRKIRKNATQYMIQQNRKFCNLPQELKIQYLSKNGITPDYLDEQVKEARESGREEGVIQAFKTLYAAAMIVLVRDIGMEKERAKEVVRAMDREVVTSLSTEDIIDKQWQETGTEFVWNDPIDRIRDT